MNQKNILQICMFGLLMMGIGVFCAFLSVTWMSYSYSVEDLSGVFIIGGSIVVMIASFFLD